MNNDKIILQTISERTGYSISMVSRALSQYKYVNSDKRKEIVSVAKELGYFKSILANISIFNELLVFIPEKYIHGQYHKIKHTSDFYNEILNGINEEAEFMNIKIIVKELEEKYITEKYYKYWLDHFNADGVIAVGFDSENVNLLNNVLEIPMIVVNPFSLGDYHNSIMPNNRSIGYKCTEYLIKKGHTKIIHLSNSNRHTFLDRQIGFTDALHDYKIKTDLENLIKIDSWSNSPNPLIELEKKVIGGRYHVTAFFCANDNMAHTLLKILDKHQISVPEDVSIIGVDNDKESQYSSPPLTSYNLPKRDLGRQAIHVLIHQQVLLNNTFTKVSLFGKIVERSSVKDLTITS